MARLAISIAGAVVGTAVGVGPGTSWLIGSTIGAAFFGPSGPKTEGPRLTDLSVQSSAEGAPVPLAYGTPRMAGNLIWSSGIIEKRTKKKVGGKGMGGSGSHVSYTYSANFAIGFCEGVAIGIKRIWADGKLIYDNGATASAGALYVSRTKLKTLRFYTGSETQTADPTIQAAETAADTPAFRGLVYTVFEELQLADFANRIPNITAEIVMAGSGSQPVRVNTWSPTVSARRARMMSGAIEYAYRTDTGTATDIFTLQTRDMQGNVIASRDLSFGTLGGSANVDYYGVTGQPRIAATRKNAAGTGDGVSAWMLDNNIVTTPISPAPYGSDHFYAMDIAPCYVSGYVYTLHQNNSNNTIGIMRRHASALVPTSKGDVFWDAVASGYVNASASGDWGTLSPGDDGLLYLNLEPTVDVTHRLLAFDTDLNVVAAYNWPAAYPADVAHPTVAVHGGYLLDLNVDISINKCRLFQLTEPELTFVGQINWTGGAPHCVSLGGGLVLTADGIISMFPLYSSTAVTVGSIVSDLCQRAGLEVGDIDTAALTDTCTAYVVARPMPARTAIEPLRRAYFFDGVESDNIVEFVKRGGAAVATLTADDLGAGSDTPQDHTLTATRQQESELPLEINISYFDLDNDHQPGLARARRLVAETENAINIELPIALTSAQAMQIADILLRTAWVERERLSFTTHRKWHQLEPTDVINLPSGRVARIVSTDYSAPGLMQVEAIAELSSGYTSIEVGTDSDLATAQSIALEGPTRLELLDIPPLSDGHNSMGFYWVAGGYFAGWRGAEIQASRDGGATYADVGATVDEATMGFCTTTLGVPVTGESGCIDNTNTVTVQLTTPSGTLSSISDAALLAGGNACIIGDELVQFGIATLNGDGTYTLSRLLRGRIGTQDYSSTHTSAERFVVLDADTIQRVDEAAADIDVEKIYRAITFGEATAEADEQSFTNTGRAITPLAPVTLNAVRDPTSGDWTFTWNRCVRVAFWWGALVDVQLEESTESYEVDIVHDDAVVRTITASSKTASYARADQITDFGGGAITFTWRVYQMSATAGRGVVAEATADIPKGGRYLWQQLFARPQLAWYAWTSAGAISDSGSFNLDGAFTGLKNANQTDVPLTNDANARSCEFTGGYASRADEANLDVTQDLTVEAWVKWSTADTDRGIVSKWGAAAADQAYQLRIGGTAGQLSFRIRTATATTEAAHAGGYNDDAWHHVMGTREGGIVKLYVDGVIKTTISGTNTGDIQDSTSSFNVASYSDGTKTFSGKVFGVALTRATLTAADALAHYNARTN